jgi:hypothetical protein
MKFVSLLLFVSVVAMCGCATAEKRSIAIAVSPVGQTALSPARLHSAITALSSELTKRGFLLASDVEGADYVMFVRLAPDSASAASGYLEVVDVQPRGKEARTGELAKLRSDARSVARELIHAASTPQ